MSSQQQRTRLVVGSVAAGLLLIGALMGLLPVSADNTPCGSPWVPSYTMADAVDEGAEMGTALIGLGLENTSTSVRQLCKDAAAPRAWAGGLIAAVGAIALFGLALTGASRRSDPVPDKPAPDAPAPE